MFHFYTPWKKSENLRFSDVFSGYRSGAFVKNGLKGTTYLMWTLPKIPKIPDYEMLPSDCVSLNSLNELSLYRNILTTCQVYVMKIAHTATSLRLASCCTWSHHLDWMCTGHSYWCYVNALCAFNKDILPTGVKKINLRFSGKYYASGNICLLF